LPNLSKQLAMLPENEGKTRFVDLTFKKELLTSRIQLAQEQAVAANKLLGELRRESEALQA
jgi:hypothetical protein